MKTRVSLLLARMVTACVAVLSVSGILRAETYEHKDGGLSFWLPDNWKADIEDSLVWGSAPSGESTLELTSLQNAADFGAAMESCRARLSKLRQWQETETPRDVILNGMKAVSLGGEALQEGRRRSVRVVVLKSPRQYVMLLWTADRGMADSLRAVYERIAGSIRPNR